MKLINLHGKQVNVSLNKYMVKWEEKRGSGLQFKIKNMSDTALTNGQIQTAKGVLTFELYEVISLIGSPDSVLSCKV